MRLASRLAGLVLLCAMVAGCGTVKNTISDGADPNLILRGNDPVAYTFKVAHYKTDAQLDAEYERRKADGTLPPELR